MIENFKLYRSIGWEVIPIIKGTKKPVQREWNGEYDENICEYAFMSGDFNVGLRLGTIVDVEADSDSANLLLNKLVGRIAHPSYKSTKSVHHLFLTPDKELTRKVFCGIEFRGYKHQSLLPPSIIDGCKYTWVTTHFPVPPMSGGLLNFYNRKRKEYGNSVWAKPNCHKCHKKITIRKSVYKRECIEFSSINMKWRCRHCRFIYV